MNTRLRRSVVALATAGICLAATSIPAGAVSATTDIVSGTLVLAKTGQTTLNLPIVGPTGGTGCTNDIDVETSSTTSSTTGTVNITGLSSISRRQPFGSTWYIREITRTASTAATNSDDHTDTASGSTVSVRVTIWMATDQSDTSTSCAHGTSTADSGTTPSDRRANWTTNIPGVTISGYTTTGGGTIAAPATSDTAVVNSSASTPLIGTSSTPFAAYSLGTVTLLGVGVHVTSVP